MDSLRMGANSRYKAWTKSHADPLPNRLGLFRNKLTSTPQLFLTNRHPRSAEYRSAWPPAFAVQHFATRAISQSRVRKFEAL